MNWRAQG
jgi:ATP-dependent Clp protease ATP-binding subunit ClpX